MQNLNIEAVQGVLGMPTVSPVAGGVVADAPTGIAGNDGFSQIVSHGIESVNASLKSSEAGLQDIAVGGPSSLHQVMIQTEEAKLSLQLAVQVRNQLLSAYQEVMRMSI